MMRKVIGENKKKSYFIFYAPNFEKDGSILLSACPSVCPFVHLSVSPFVRLFVRPFKKNLKLGF